jgi:uncharacterized repeat protein (TIGR03803 family)
MYRKTQRAITTATIISAILMLITGASAQTGTILYSFTGSKDGANPKSRLVLDKNGNLYGTTTAGGANGQGEVFELTPSSRGGWLVKVLYSFQGSADGSLPAAGVIFDQKGNLYGTLYNGGALGHGAVFELSPATGGGWTKKLLYSFSGANDGGQPVGALVLDKAGNLYGTTPLDGLYGQGVVYQLKPNSDGTWTETVLHAFVSQTTTDGQGPAGSLAIDKAGNLYGVTVQGGTASLGTVFEVSPVSGGGWTESVLYSFLGNNDGAGPATSDVITNTAGTVLFGTTTTGGSANDGTVFEMKKTGNGWKEKVLYTFPGGANGGNPYAGVIRDAAGNLYGTTASGVFGAGGVVFELTPGTGGTWTETVLYTVDGPGNGSYAGLVFDAAGNLYGTTEFGGPQLAGDVFQVTP